LKTWHCLGVLFIAVFGAYFNCLGNGLVDFDDAVVLHPQGAFGVANVKRLPADILKIPLHALSAVVTARPLAGLSHMLDLALFAEDHWGHHLSSVAYHFLACCFAFLAAAELLGSRSAGLAAALVFALHPVQTESVAYLAGRRDILCGLLCLASLYLWLKGLRAGRTAAWSVGLWALALTAKPAAVTLPLLWAASAAALKPKELKDHLARNWRLYAVCAAACLTVAAVHLTMNVERPKNIPSELLWHGGSAAAQWATEPRIVLHALQLMVWPAVLNADYSPRVFDISRSFLEPRALLALAACGGLAWLAWALRRKRPLASFALAWIMLTYAPMLHVFPALHNNEVFTEHWLYLPIFGFALLSASLLNEFRRWPRASWLCFGLLLCLCAARTVVRNRDWKDAFTLWSKTVATYPRCGRAHGVLGRILLQRGNWRAAEANFLQAAELRPEDPRNLTNLAELYSNTGRFGDAEQALLQARKLPLSLQNLDYIDYSLDLTYLNSGRPDKMRKLDELVRVAGPERRWRASSLNLAGLAAAARGDVATAEKAYLRALAVSPDAPDLLYNLGVLYYAQRQFDMAARNFEGVLKGDPANMRALQFLALSYAESGEAARARRALDLALKRAPRSVEAWLAASSFHLKLKEFPEALAAAKQAARLERSPRTDRQLYLVYRGM